MSHLLHRCRKRQAECLTGDSILFVDGFDRALKIPDKGYPGMSLQETESEKAIAGKQ